MKYKIEELIYNLFTITNHSRILGKYVGYFFVFGSYMQIASLLHFYTNNEEIDEFEKGYPFLSVVLNYPIYLLREKSKNSSISIYDIFGYSIIGMFTVMFIFSLVLSNMKSNMHFKYEKFLFLFKYLLLFYQFFFFIPLCLVFGNIEYSYNNIEQVVINVFMLILTLGFQIITSYVNIISSISEYDFFYSIDTTISINLMFMQGIMVIASIIILKSPIFLFAGYIAFYLFLFKMTYDYIVRFLFSNYSFNKINAISLIVLYERAINSVVMKYTFNKYGKMYYSYYIPSIIIFYFVNEVFDYVNEACVLNYSLSQCVLNKVSSLNEIIKYAKSLTYLFSQIENEFIYKKIGLCIHHYKTCTNERCIFKIEDENEPAQQNFNFDNNTGRSNFLSKLESNSLLVIKELYETHNVRNKHSFDFIVEYVQFLIFYINNFELAMVEIETALINNSLCLSQKIVLKKLNQYAKELIIQKSANQFLFSYTNNDSVWKISTMLSVITYDKTANEMKNEIYIAVEQKRKFWLLLENEDIVIEELYETGRKFFKHKSILGSLWKKINKISNKNVDSEITLLYCDFLSKVCEDKIDSELILERIGGTSENYQDELYSNRFKSDTGVIMIKGDQSVNPGLITYINDALLKFLKYDNKNELLGNNIKCIIPGEIGNVHDEIIKNYFEKGKSQITKKTLSFLSVKSKKKYLLPVHILVTFLPNYQDTIEGISLIRPRVNTHETIICNEDGIIDSSTERIAQLLNLTPEQFEKNTCYVETFFPKLMKPEGNNKTPKFFSEEIMVNLKKTELKVDILCPKVNMLDKKKYKIKTRNINDTIPSSQSDNTDRSSNSMITNNNNSPKSNSSISIHDSPPYSPRKIGTFTLGGSPVSKHQSNKEILVNLIKERFSPRRRTKTQSEYPEQKKLCKLPKLTSQKKLVYQYHNKFEQVSSSRNLSEKDKHDHAKISNIFRRLTSSLILNTLTEKTEITLYHLCLKVLNQSVKVRILTIPSDSLFTVRKNDDHLSAFSVHGVEENSRYKKIAQDDEDKKREIQYEVGSVSSGKDSSLSLAKYLKTLKEKPNDDFHNHMLIGILMSIVTFAITISIMVAITLFFRYSRRFVQLTFQYFSTLNYLLNISKFSSLELTELHLSIKLSDEDLKLFGSTSQHLIDNGVQLLGIFREFLRVLNQIFGFDFVKTDFNTAITYSSSNWNIVMSFINGVYKIIHNSVDLNYLTIKENIINFSEVFYQNFIILSQNFESKYFEKKDIYSYVLLIFVIFCSFFNLLMLTFLIISYRSKRKEHFQIISAFEQIKNSEIFSILEKIDKFESKYIEIFKNFEAFKGKKIFCNLEKSENVISKKNENRLRKKQLAQKSHYNILGTSEQMQETNNLLMKEANSKLLIMRENIKQMFIVNTLIIQLIVILFSLGSFLLGRYFIQMMTKYQTISYNLLMNRFFLNFSFYRYSLLFINFFKFIKLNDEKEKNDKLILNKTLSIFNDLSADIKQNFDLFDSNISIIMNDEICNITELNSIIKTCQIDEYQYTLQKGIKSLVSFYLKNIEESYSIFENYQSNIANISQVYLNSNTKISRLVIEDILIVFEDIYYQINHNLRSHINNGILFFCILCFGFVLIFLGLVFLKLKLFIQAIKDEEILCNRLIGEIPYDIIMLNNDLRIKLKGVCPQK